MSKPAKRKIDPPPPSKYLFSDDLYVERGIVAAWIIPNTFPADTRRQYAQVLLSVVLRYHDVQLHPWFPQAARELVDEVNRASAGPPAESVWDTMSARELRDTMDMHLKAIATIVSTADQDASVSKAEMAESLRREIFNLSIPVYGTQIVLEGMLKKLFDEMFGAGLFAPPPPSVDTLDLDALAEFQNIDVVHEAQLVEPESMAVVPATLASDGEQKVRYMGSAHERAIRAGSTHRAYLLSHLGLGFAPADVPRGTLDLSQPATRELLRRVGQLAAELLRERRPGVRDLDAVVERVVLQCAQVDRFATIVAAIQTMRTLAGQVNLVQEPWRYLVPRGADILQLYFDYAQLPKSTTAVSRRAELVDRARRIWASIAPHFDRAAP